jgi:hypothetical protein
VRLWSPSKGINVSEAPDAKTYHVYEADERGKPVRLERSYDTVAEVLAHCVDKPKVIRVGDDYFSLDGFMATHVSAG